MAEASKWYVIHTYSGYENKVAENIKKVVENRNLQDLIQEVSVPVETDEEIVNGKVKKIERKIFPGYVIVKMVLTDDSWYVVRNIRGVTGFVGPGSDPVPLTDEEVKKMGMEVGKKSVGYKVGDHVRILSGSLVGSVGVVHEIDLENNVVTVSAHMLGRDTNIEIGLDQVALFE